MNIIVIDDQPDVVRGIVAGVDWKKLKIRHVFTAGSSQEAKAVLGEHPVDLMLCDIEMPMGSGLELLRWVREHYGGIQCVFLTAHADFSYVQTALQLGAVDYLLQPSSYEKIAQVLERVIAQIRNQRIVQEYYTLGRDAEKEERRFRENLIRDYVQGIETSADVCVQRLQAFGLAATRETPCQCMLIQVVRWEDSAESWETDLFLYAVRNVLSELLETHGGFLSIVPVEPGQYLMVRIGGAPGTDDGLKEALTQFVGFCHTFLQMLPACHVDVCQPFFAMAASLSRLRRAAENNVADQEGAFFLCRGAGECQAYQPPDMRPWSALLEQGYYDRVRGEIRAHLEALGEEGKLNLDSLFQFQQDFLQMFFDFLHQYQTQAHEVFAEKYNHDAILRSYTSLNRMLDLVDFVIQYLEDKQSQEQPGHTQMDRILGFIGQNLHKNIGRKEIAEGVYLNPEYLSRLFKREKGIALSEYLTGEKMKVAEILLRTTSFSIGIIASKTGYVNFSHFAQAFKKIYGISPSDYRQQSLMAEQT